MPKLPSAHDAKYTPRWSKCWRIARRGRRRRIETPREARLALVARDLKSAGFAALRGTRRRALSGSGGGGALARGPRSYLGFPNTHLRKVACDVLGDGLAAGALREKQASARRSSRASRGVAQARSGGTEVPGETCFITFIIAEKIALKNSPRSLPSRWRMPERRPRRPIPVAPLPSVLPPLVQPLNIALELRLSQLLVNLVVQVADVHGESLSGRHHGGPAG